MKDQAGLIKFFAVVTAIPRWVVALMAAEGFVLPVSWKPWWMVFSALSAAGMAIVEGVAFAFVFNAWKRERSPSTANKMLALAILSAVLFVALLSPSIAASVREQTVGQMLNNDYLLWIWSAIVAASTISIVAGVGYAERSKAALADTPKSSLNPPAKAESQPESIRTPERTLQTYEDFEHLMRTGNGSAPKSAADLQALGVPRSTSFEWMKAYRAKEPVIS